MAQSHEERHIHSFWKVADDSSQLDVRDDGVVIAQFAPQCGDAGDITFRHDGA